MKTLTRIEERIADLEAKDAEAKAADLAEFNSYKERFADDGQVDDLEVDVEAVRQLLGRLGLKTAHLRAAAKREIDRRKNQARLAEIPAMQAAMQALQAEWQAVADRIRPLQLQAEELGRKIEAEQTEVRAAGLSQSTLTELDRLDAQFHVPDNDEFSAENWGGRDDSPR